MRISKKYQNIIKDNALLIFGENTKVYLFGSRIDDSKNGGDIDLFIETNEKDRLYEKKIKFSARLYRLLGEQKIDIVISKNKNRMIEKIALSTGVLL